MDYINKQYAIDLVMNGAKSAFNAGGDLSPYKEIICNIVNYNPDKK